MQVWEAVITEAQMEESNKLHAAKQKVSPPSQVLGDQRSSALVYPHGPTAEYFDRGV